MAELTFLSASEMAARVRSGQVSARELMQEHLERIAAVEPLLHAVVQLDADGALAEAERADREQARGSLRGPLHGVPFTVKDWIETAGLVCAAGEEARRTYVPAADATAVARMRAGGGILLGKTNVTVGPQIFGRTNNPYDLERSPAASGSSGGEAALIAAGGSPLGLGSDSGGSIRTPAHACGIAGLKPTSGRVPSTGHVPPISFMNDPRTTIGPLARSVADLALCLPIIQGVDWRDASVVPMPLGDWRQVDLGTLRIVFYTQHPGATPSPACADAALAAVGALANVAASVEPVLPPRIGEAEGITEDYWRRPESADPEDWQPDAATRLTSEAVERHLFEWDRFRRALAGFMEQVDVIVTPAAELPAQPHGTDAGGIAYTLAYSLTGYPAVVVRVGTSAEGLPVGVQVVARPWRDDVALATAAFLEGAFGGWRPPVLVLPA
ncbi:MAG: amidase [Candidatus Limnocylindrales bacterium]